VVDLHVPPPFYVTHFPAILFSTSCPSIFYVQYLLLQVFLQTGGVVFPLGVAAPVVENALLVVAEVLSEVAEPEVDVVAVLIPPGVAAPVVESAVVVVAEPGVVFVSLVSVADVVEPQASFDIALAFDVLVPVSVVAVGVDSSECPRYLVPNVDYYSSSSSSVEVVDQESFHSSTGVRTNYGLCSSLSNPDLHQNKNLEHRYSKPNPCHNNLSDTNDPPIDATTNHSRKTCLH